MTELVSKMTGLHGLFSFDGSLQWLYREKVWMKKTVGGWEWRKFEKKVLEW